MSEDEFAEPRAIASLIDGLSCPWGIGGGWAIDLFLGTKTRDHSDVDVAILRRDQALVRGRLGENWTFDVVIPPVSSVNRRQWVSGEYLEPPLHEIHGRSNAQLIELLLNEAEGEDWVFRRDSRVRRPLASVFLPSAVGMPAIAPDVALLFKAKDPRDHDVADLRAAMPKLTGEQVEWLRDAVLTAHPASRFAEMLARRAPSRS